MEMSLDLFLLDILQHSKKSTAKSNLFSKKLGITVLQAQLDQCVDLKMLRFLLGLQGRHTKFPCFMCMWDSRAREQHWIKKKWPVRKQMMPREKNIQAQPLVERSKIVFPPLHIKLGVMKQFVKALSQEGECFKYICTKFPGLTIEKSKSGIFDGPQIRKSINDQELPSSVSQQEFCAFLKTEKHPTTKSLWLTY